MYEQDFQEASKVVLQAMTRARIGLDLLERSPMLTTRSKRTLLFAIIGISMLLTHLPIIDQSPRGPHTWRQCHTLAVARNFQTEGMNIFRPRVDKRNDGSGVTGMQFPSYEYILAMSYRIIGEHNATHRLFSLLLTFLSCIAIYRIALDIFRFESIALLGAAMLPWSPDLFYHSSNALPDVLALCAGLWGFALALDWRTTHRSSTIIWASAYLLIAGLTKIQFLSFGFPLLVLIYQDRNRQEINKTDYRIFIELSSLILMLTVGWYIYARLLRQTSGLLDFGLHFNPVESISEGLLILKQNIISDLPELYLNYASFALMIIGLAHFMRMRFRRSEWTLPGVVWGVSLLVYHMLELGQMKDHAYYAMVYLLPLMLLAINGIRAIKGRIRSAVIWGFIALMPVLAYARMHHRWTGPQNYVPEVLYDNDRRKAFVSEIPKGLCIVGPDISGSIYYYYLDREGYGFADPSELENETYLTSMIGAGASILISDHPMVRMIPAVQSHTDSLIAEEGAFYALRLKK